jgi:hypothetical protein
MLAPVKSGKKGKKMGKKWKCASTAVPTSDPAQLIIIIWTALSLPIRSLTAEAQRAQMTNSLFGGEMPANKGIPGLPSRSKRLDLNHEGMELL